MKNEINIINTIESILKKYKIDEYQYKKKGISHKLHDFLEKKGFNNIGGGEQSEVFRKGNSPYVLKIQNSYGGMTEPYTNDLESIGYDADYVKHFLKYTYISPSKLFAVQPYAETDPESLKKAKEILGGINTPDNMGMHRGKPVIIDPM